MTQGQTAATVAAAIQLDYQKDQPQAAPPFPFLKTINIPSKQRPMDVH